jgi:small-conductance mechanosensitive channel
LKKNIAIFIIASALLGFWYYGLGGASALEGTFHEGTVTFIHIVLMVAGLFLLYIIAGVILKGAMLKGGAKEGEITMIFGVVKVVFLFVGFLSILSEWFTLGTLGSIFAAFGGMFLGWSLQGPVSGLAGWFLISINRPFTVGDRVQLPTQALVGDVISISPLYTVLNQVGGSVGSEEPANRTILIPNAMLFSTLVINYTPKNQDKLIEQFQKKFEVQEASSKSSFMLDEFILRLTFDSDWDEAERILLEAAKEVTADIIRETGQEPYIRADVSDWYGVNVRLRFMTLATERPRIMYELTRKILKDIQASDKVDIAIPYVYSFKRPFSVKQHTKDHLSRPPQDSKEKGSG